MKAERKIANSNNNLIGNFLSGLFFILVIAGIANAFIQTDGTGYIKKTWNDIFKVRKAPIATFPTPTPIVDCQRVYSGSQKKFINICKKTKSEALTECSKRSRESLVKVGSSLKTVNDLEKLRELLMRMCMQEAGFDY